MRSVSASKVAQVYAGVIGAPKLITTALSALEGSTHLSSPQSAQYSRLLGYPSLYAVQSATPQGQELSGVVGLVVGLVVGFVVGFVVGLVVGFVVGLFVGLFVALLGILSFFAFFFADFFADFFAFDLEAELSSIIGDDDDNRRLPTKSPKSTDHCIDQEEDERFHLLGGRGQRIY